MEKPRFSIEVENGTISVSSDGIDFFDIVLGVFSFCQEVADSNESTTDEIIDVFTEILKSIEPNPDDEETE